MISNEDELSKKRGRNLPHLKHWSCINLHADQSSFCLRP
uniref:Uncharacterized protein n=1 Tax=Anguilla anguilla TaxID=7936 RepID=A0A0E9U3P2_ANGAN